VAAHACESSVASFTICEDALSQCGFRGARPPFAYPGALNACPPITGNRREIGVPLNLLCSERVPPLGEPLPLAPLELLERKRRVGGGFKGILELSLCPCCIPLVDKSNLARAPQQTNARRERIENTGVASRRHVGSRARRSRCARREQGRTTAWHSPVTFAGQLESWKPAVCPAVCLAVCLAVRLLLAASESR